MISDIRFITDYSPDIISDSDIQDGIRFSQREMVSMLPSGADPFNSDERNVALRALMWATCYHLKVKNGEIEGGDFSIAELDIETISSEDSLYLRKFKDNFLRLSSGNVYGHINSGRSDRTYGFDNSATGGNV